MRPDSESRCGHCGVADGVVDLFGRPICPWLRWLPRLARQHAVVTSWCRGCRRVGTVGTVWVEECCAPVSARVGSAWLFLATSCWQAAAPSAVRRSAASVPTSLPPSPGSRPHGTDDGRRDSAGGRPHCRHRRRRGVLNRRLLRPLLRLQRRAARPGGRAAGGGPGQPGCRDVTRFGPGSRVTSGPARAATRRRRRRRGVLAVVPPRAAAVPPQSSARGKAGHASSAAFRCPSSPNFPKFPIPPPPDPRGHTSDTTRGPRPYFPPPLHPTPPGPISTQNDRATGTVGIAPGMGAPEGVGGRGRRPGGLRRRRRAPSGGGGRAGQALARGVRRRPRRPGRQKRG